MKQGLVKLFLFSNGILGIYGDVATAQVIPNIVPDATLGTENSIVAPNLPFTTRITGGATRGGNLFHSFQELSIGPNQTAWFDNPASIQSILVRVTGKNRSEIDGTLRANGIADLFIINPNGVTFGQTAKLNIGGAISVLTTPGIPLGDRGLFSASAPEQSQLLAIKPSALFDLARFQPQGDLIFKANWATQGQAVTFVGKPIVMTGRVTNTLAPTTLTLRSASDINLTKVQINNNPSGKALYLPEAGFAPMRLILEADRNITIQDSDIGLYGGLFQAIAPGKITLERSRLLTQSFINKLAEPISFQGGAVEIKGKSTREAEAAAITIATDKTIQRAPIGTLPVELSIQSKQPILIENTRINQPPKNAQGQDEPELYPVTFDPSRAGKRSNFYPTRITLDSQENITIKSSKIAVRSGRFQANTPKDFLFQSSQLYSDNYTDRASEPIVVQAQNITLDGAEGMSGNAIYAGRAADILLTAGNNLTLKNNAGIGSNTIYTGDAGNVMLKAGNLMTVDTGGFGNQSGAKNFANNEQVTGNNGEIIIAAKNITLKNFGFNMDHFSQGGGGLIKLRADETIDIGEGGIGTNAKGNAIGANILVEANQVIMRPKSALSTSTEKDSTGGNITVKAKNQFILQGSVSTGTNGEKSAGNIDVLASQITIDEGTFGKNTGRGNISSYTGTANGKSATVKGDSGEISLKTIDGNGQILLQSGGGIVNTVFKSSTGSTGKIVIAQAGQLDVKSGSQILAATNGLGKTGLIDIQTSRSVNLTGSSKDKPSPSGILNRIEADSNNSSSEGITINTSRLEINDGAGVISTTLGQGNSGKVTITAGQAIFSDKTDQGRSSGVLTSVGLGGIPGGELLKVDSGDPRFSRTTLNPLVIGKSDNSAATGDSGAIKLNVGSLDILKGAQLITAIVGEKAKAGDISIQSKGDIRLLDQGAIRADSNSGEGGKIDIISDGILLLRRGGEISAVSRGDGKDVNIDITTPFIVGILNENSNIFAVSDAALKGGQRVGSDIKINATGILGFQYSKQFTAQNDILATGNVTLNLPDIDPSRGLTVLPTTPIDIAQKIDKRCNPDAATQSSSFVTRGTGGLPASPRTPIGPNGLVRLAQVGNEKASVEISPKITTTPMEAQTSRRLANGRIRFQSNTQESISQNYRSDCLNRPDR
jgi:filamentous hemagglutinin family protein